MANTWCPCPTNVKIRPLHKSSMKKVTIKANLPTDLEFSTNWHQRDAFAAIVAREALAAGVHCYASIHQEGIAMMPMFEFDGNEPGFIGHLLHAVRRGIPSIEITDQADRLGLGRIANEIDS